MIIGQKHNNDFNRNEILEKVKALKEAFGIEFHYLEKLSEGILR